MRTRCALVVAAVLACALHASATQRILSTGKLHAAQSHDFSCSVVNKDPGNNVSVTLELKNPDGTTYVNPATFQPATLQTTLLPFEAAMLTAPAAFVGDTTLYCWADVPFEAIVFGAFLVRDAGDRATSAVPLQEDVVDAAQNLGEGLETIHAAVDAIEPAGPLTGRMLMEVLDVGASTIPPGGTAAKSATCLGIQVALGGGCRALDQTGTSPQIDFSAFEDAPLGNLVFPKGWQCRWRNNSGTSEVVRFAVELICADAAGGL